MSATLSNAVAKEVKDESVEVEDLRDRNTSLPQPSEWPHRPIYLCTGSRTTTTDTSPGEALPLGVPFAFETPLFKGKMLVRFCKIKSNDEASHKAYFAGRSRVMQTVVQGQFKKAVNMGEVYVGSVYQQAMNLAPPPYFMGLLNMLFQRIAPGSILDLASAEPRVMALYAGTAQTVSVNNPGEEPDMTAVELPEHFPDSPAVASGAATKGQSQPFRSVQERKRTLSKRAKAESYLYDPAKVYTMQIFDESMDYGSFSIRLPIYGNFSLINAIGPQPMTLTAVTTDGEIMYDFHVWHESVYRLKHPETA